MMAATDLCVFCGSVIRLANDGAWEDESGACGCGRGEHQPRSEAGPLTLAAAEMADLPEEH